MTNKLYKNIHGFGPRPSDKDFFKITKTQYNPNPDQKINNYELILNTPTVKAYLDAPVKTIVLSIRGTTDSRDVLADTMIAFNRLKYSNRYIEDKNIISNLITQYPPNDYDYYGTAHSLGVALLRQLQREFPFIKNTVGFNGAVQPYDLIDQKQNLNKSYYTEDDGLYKLGGRFLANKTVIPSTENVIKNPFNRITPAPVKTGLFVYNAAVGHKLENFESLLGGAISRMREKLNKMTVKEIKEAVKNELNGAIQGYSRMKKEDLINAIRDYQKKKKGSKKSEEPKITPKKSEEPKVKEVKKKIGKREQFLIDEREKKILYLAETVVDRLKSIEDESISKFKQYKKLHKYCRKYIKSYSRNSPDIGDREKREKYEKKYNSKCYSRYDYQPEDTLRFIKGYIQKTKDVLNGRYDSISSFGKWYEENYPEEYKKLPYKYIVKDEYNFMKFDVTNDEKLKIKLLIEKMGYPNIDKYIEELEYEVDTVYDYIKKIDKEFDEKKKAEESKKKDEPKKSEEPKITPKKSEEPKVKEAPTKKYKYLKYIEEMDGDYFDILIYQEYEFKDWINWIEKLIEKSKKQQKQGSAGLIYRPHIFFNKESKGLLDEAFEYLSNKYGVKEGLKLLDKNIEKLLIYLDFNDSYSDPVGYYKNLNTKNRKLFSSIYGIGKSEAKNSEKRYNHINGGSCMCHVKDVVRGGAIEERQIKTLDDFKTTELRKIASIFNKFFKIKLTKLSRDEILNELKKYIYLSENGSIFVNEDNFFSLKPKAMLKEIETKKLENKIKKEAKPKTRRDILQKEKIGDLRALLISLGGDPTYKYNGRITPFSKKEVIDEILVQEFKKKKMKI